MVESETKQFIRFLKDHDAWHAFVRNMKDHKKFTCKHINLTDVRGQLTTLGRLREDDMKIYLSKVSFVHALMDAFLFALCENSTMWWSLNSMWINRAWIHTLGRTKNETE